jgi:hypothetical protein
MSPASYDTILCNCHGATSDPFPEEDPSCNVRS